MIVAAARQPTVPRSRPLLTTDGMLEQVIENAEYDAMQPDGNPYSQMDALCAMLKASPPGYRGYIGKKIMTSPSCLL